MGGAGTQQLLERIVEQLEQSPLSITTRCAQVLVLFPFVLGYIHMYSTCSLPSHFLMVEACTKYK